MNPTVTPLWDIVDEHGSPYDLCTVAGVPPAVGDELWIYEEGLKDGLQHLFGVVTGVAHNIVMKRDGRVERRVTIVVRAE